MVTRVWNVGLYFTVHKHAHIMYLGLLKSNVCTLSLLHSQW